MWIRRPGEWFWCSTYSSRFFRSRFKPRALQLRRGPKTSHFITECYVRENATPKEPPPGLNPGAPIYISSSSSDKWQCRTCQIYGKKNPSCYCYLNEPEKWDDIVAKYCKEVLVAKDIWTLRFPQQSFKNENKSIKNVFFYTFSGQYAKLKYM